MTNPDTIPAFILGNGFSALGTLQILGRQQIPAFVLTPPDEAIRSSKWYAEFTVDGTRCDRPDGLAPFLESLVIERAVLIPCSDEYALAVAELSDQLKSRFPASLPPADTIALLTDKLQLADTMRSLDLPHAASIAVESADMVRELVSDIDRRGFLKPRNSQPFFRDYQTKAFWYDSVDEAVDLFQKATGDGHRMIWQEFIDGPPSRHFYVEGFVDRTGETRALFARRRRRMYPARFGNSSAMVSIPLEEVPVAIDTMNRLLNHLDYRGVFSAEFKDDQGGLPRLLEVNPRPWWYVNVAAQCGVDVIRMAYDDALEREVQAIASYQSGVEFVYHYLDYHAVHLEGIPIAGMLRKWATARPTFYSSDDPNPSIQKAATWTKKKFMRLFDRK